MQTSAPPQDGILLRLRRWAEGNREQVTIFAILLMIIGISAIVSEDFRSSRNAFNVLRQAVALGLVSVGQTAVILSGGIDLSVGATISLVAVYTSGLMAGREGLSVILPILILMLTLAMFIGAINAAIINFLKVAPFITTLATAVIIQGLVLLYAKAPVGRISPGWEWFAEGMVGPVPVPVIFLLLLVAGSAIFLRRTIMGRYVVATGGDQTIARLSGIETRTVLFYTYMFCSVTAALSALFLTSRMGIGDPQIGGLNFDRFDLDSIAAVLIGGTRLGGGKGTVVGTLAGVLIVAVLNNIFNLTGLSTYYQWIVKGLIILAAVTAYSVRRLGEGG